MSSSSQNDDSTNSVIESPQDVPISTPPTVSVAVDSGTVQPPSDPIGPVINRSKGGPATHKPGCRCRPCAARARQQEAVAGGTRPDAPEAPTEIRSLATTREIAPGVVAELSDAPNEPVSKTKAHVAGWIRAKAANPDASNIEIAKELGITVRNLRAALYKGRKQGWLEFSDPLNELKYGMVPKAMENLNLFLDARDKDITRDVLKATVFAEYQAAEGIQQQPNTVFALKIEVPEGFDKASAAANIKGVIVGKGLGFEVIDAEKVEV